MDDANSQGRLRNTPRWNPANERKGAGPTRARVMALRVLERVQRGGAYADLTLKSALARSDLAPSDRKLTTELVYGTLRWRGRLDYLLEQVSNRNLESIESIVATILRLGAYQILFTDRIRAAAAVDQMVRCARVSGAERACGFVNAVLRRLSRESLELRLPTLDSDPLGYLTHTLSLPEWLSKRWMSRFGIRQAAALARAANQVPPMTIRANISRVSRDDLAAELRERFPDLELCRHATHGLTLNGRLQPGSDSGFRSGLFTVQDESSQAIVDLLDPQPGDRVLDVCAAPGTKTSAIAERVGAQGQVIAMDRHSKRLKMVERDARRLGLANVKTQVQDATQPLSGFTDAKFDRVLVDAPCTGLGILRRNPDARWRVKPDDPAHLGMIQLRILSAAARCVSPGGTLVYSTCSFEPEENESVIGQLLNNVSRLSLTPQLTIKDNIRGLIEKDGFLRCFPHQHGSDGFFGARMEHIF